MIMMIYLFTAIGLTSGGSSTVHICTQTIYRTTQSTQTVHRTTQLTKREVLKIMAQIQFVYLLGS